jgi:hypothetical protein
MEHGCFFPFGNRGKKGARMRYSGPIVAAVVALGGVAVAAASAGPMGFKADEFTSWLMMPIFAGPLVMLAPAALCCRRWRTGLPAVIAAVALAGVQLAVNHHVAADPGDNGAGGVFALIVLAGLYAVAGLVVAGYLLGYLIWSLSRRPPARREPVSR